MLLTQKEKAEVVIWDLRVVFKLGCRNHLKIFIQFSHLIKPPKSWNALHGLLG